MSRRNKERLPGKKKKIGMISVWEKKKGKTSKFVVAGGYDRNEREENWRLGMGRQRGGRTGRRK